MARIFIKNILLTSGLGVLGEDKDKYLISGSFVFPAENFFKLMKK